MRLAELPRSEAKDDFAELDAVAVGERPFDRIVRQAHVIHDDRIRPPNEADGQDR